MSFKDYFLEKHPDFLLPRIKVIDGCYRYNRGYDCVSFKKILEYYYPGKDLFKEDFERRVLDEFLKSKPDQIPVVSKILFSDIKYYQDEIKLETLDIISNNNSYKTELVEVVKYNSELILLNGYHRTTLLLIGFNQSINCNIY